MIGLWKPSKYGCLLLLICAYSAAGTGCGQVSSFTAVQTGLTRQITAAALPGEAVTAAALTGLEAGAAVAAEHGEMGDDLTAPGAAGVGLAALGAASDDLAATGAAGVGLAATGASGVGLAALGAASDDLAGSGAAGVDLTAAGAARGMAAAAPWSSVPNPGSKSEFPDYLESDTGLFTYYNQGDSRWAEERFGPSDPIRTHGCGPTALAMLVSSYTSTPLTPLQAALWASQHGCCIPGEGSTHAIIEKGAAAFGLSAASLPRHTSDAILDALADGQAVVALMGPGYFSNSGHFIIIIRSLEDGTVRIADPGNAENCGQNWEIPFLISQLKKSASNGGPLWTVGYQEP